MSIYDIVMLVVFGGAIWFGYWKGLAWQVASVAAIVVSYIVSVNFREPVSQFIQAGEPWNKIGAMLILFLGTSLLIWTLYASVAKSIKKMELKGFDRQAGAMLGAVKGVLLCMVITMFAVSLLGPQAHQAIHSSKSGPYIEKGIWQVSAIVPAELAAYVDPHLEKYKNAAGGIAPTSDPNGFFGGNAYPIGQTPSPNNPNQLPPSNAPAYQGQWQTPSTPWTQQPQNNQYNSQYGTQYGTQYGGRPTQTQPVQTQPNQTQQQYSGTWGRLGTSAGVLPKATTDSNGWPGFNISVNSKEVLDAAKKAGVEAFRNSFENQQR